MELALSGARAERTAYGPRLILEGSGRALAYSRLRAVDANGKELKARMEVAQPNAESRKQKAERRNESEPPDVGSYEGRGGCHEV